MNILQKLTYLSIRTVFMLWVFIFGPIIGLMIGNTLLPNSSDMFIIGIIVWIIGIGVVCVIYPIICPEDK